MRTIFFFSSFLLVQFLAAQDEVTVLHVSGTVQYFPNYGAKPKAIYPGMMLALTGKIRCKGSASAKLIYKGAPIMVSGSKMRDVQDVVKSAGKSSQLSFTGRFFNFINESVKDANSDEKLKKYHRRYMSESSGGVDGMAKPHYSIQSLPLTSGKLRPANVIFKWRNVPGEGPYTFFLRAENGKTIAQLLVRDTAITLDLEQLALNLDEDYTWNVERGERDKSEPLEFEICPESAENEQMGLENEASYQSADTIERKLMAAYRLEEEHCFYSAYQTYARLLAESPENLVYRRMFACFLVRMDMLPEAEQIAFKH